MWFMIFFSCIVHDLDEWGPTYGRASYEGAFPPGPYDEGFDGGNSYESNGFGGYGGGWEDK